MSATRHLRMIILATTFGARGGDGNPVDPEVAADHVNLGFAYDGGSFNTVTLNDDGSFGRLTSHVAPPRPDSTYEW